MQPTNEKLYFITLNYSETSTTMRLSMIPGQRVADAMMVYYGKQLRPVQKKAIDEGRYSLKEVTLQDWWAEKREIW